ncbi:MAG: gluconate 2-dehydrogenase subunit 3 family protein [Gemmatimonadota bacterium]|nr:gluconate 2-dehydrogenase subunit 3 family protein [Gemmatimonadota bacterium]
MNRREAVRILAVFPFGAALSLSSADQERAWGLVANARRLAAEGVAFAPRFFTPAEFRTVGVLSDMIIPRDERSGSATDAGVPEFMDFMMTDRPSNQSWMRTGLEWINALSSARFGKPFADASVAERDQILNDIAWPARAHATVADGVTFFNQFRDLTSSGFWSSRMGVEDLRYIGNTFNPSWDGCPPEALAKLGVTYAKFDPKNVRLTPQ